MAGRPAKLTPSMRQWWEAKEAHPDAIIFFRLGDFYEMFHDDAVVSARELDLTLTSRDKQRGADATPMCGVPYHAGRGYLARLVAAGYKVAVCEQMEDPSQVKGIVRREVVEVVTPGVMLDTEHLDARAANYLVAVAWEGPRVGVACADVSTGEFRITEPDDQSGLIDELTRLMPRELLLSEAAPERGLGEALERLRLQITLSRRPREDFDPDRADERLREHFGVATLEGFGARGLGPALSAAAALLRYVQQTQSGLLRHLARLVPYRATEFMILDESTAANLEIRRTLMGGKRHGSLLGVIDRTVTAMGARRLAQYLAYPLVDVAGIKRRQSAVAELREQSGLRGDLREHLGRVKDLERLAGRASADVAHGKDLAGLRDSIAELPALRELLERAQSGTLLELGQGMPGLEGLHGLLARALVEQPPTSLRDGGLICRGYSAELDELVDISTRGKDFILGIESRERERTGISSLKVRYNKVFGYFIEVTRANLHAVPEDYQRKQTLANAERFITPELKEYEEKVLGAEERRTQLEYELFCGLRRSVVEEAEALSEAARTLSELDVLAALAELAADHDYVCPEVDEGEAIEIEDGRHPVIECMAQSEGFVPNDTELQIDGAQLQIITGPNMAGKSTYIRQVALITLLAQVGSFVPARRARIGVVDRIFTRVGASDNLARGQSTFMVEMVETANILHHASRRSLVVLDEIGRGTSTFDGLSIAWAVAEYVHDVVGARTLFATHYHELTDLVRTKSRVRNYSVAVKEWNEEIIFLRRVVSGAANRSYGIQVARLAGLPDAVLTRAREVLSNLEDGELDAEGRVALAKHHDGDNPPPPQLSLFASSSARPSKADRLLQQTDPDELTPRQAHDLLYRLVTLARER